MVYFQKHIVVVKTKKKVELDLSQNATISDL